MYIVFFISKPLESQTYTCTTIRFILFLNNLNTRNTRFVFSWGSQILRALHKHDKQLSWPRTEKKAYQQTQFVVPTRWGDRTHFDGSCPNLISKSSHFTIRRYSLASSLTGSVDYATLFFPQITCKRRAATDRGRSEDRAIREKIEEIDLKFLNRVDAYSREQIPNLYPWKWSSPRRYHLPYIISSNGVQ